MNPHFREAIEALKRAGEQMLAANEAMKIANEATQAAHASLVQGIRSVLEANAEHLDLRETVERLQTTMLAQSADIKALREEVRALKNGRR